MFPSHNALSERWSASENKNSHPIYIFTRSGHQLLVPKINYNLNECHQLSPLSKRFPRCLSTEIDTIHFFTKSRSELTANIDNFIDRIKQDGMIWVSWPKKSAKVPTDVTEDVIREVILPRGLVDVMVCAIDEVWSGLKLVFRKENRV